MTASTLKAQTDKSGSGPTGSSEAKQRRVADRVLPNRPPVRVGASMTVDRYRIRFCKRDSLRWIGHHDLVRTLERLFRRAGVELQQSLGFHPKPKLRLPSALSLGIAGIDEVMEIDLVKAWEPEPLLKALSSEAPSGLVFCTAEKVAPGGKKAQLAKSTYELKLPPEKVDEVSVRAAALLAKPSIQVTRRSSPSGIEVRHLLDTLCVREGVLEITLIAGRQAGLRVRDVLELLELSGLDAQGHVVTRTRVELLS